MPLSRSARARKGALKMWARGRPRTRSTEFWKDEQLPAAKPPTGLVSFARRYSDDDQCRAYLYKKRWPLGFVCPTCQNRTGYILASRNSVECQNKHQTSLTAGTAMHHTQLPLHQWFFAAWMLSTEKPGFSAVQFQRQMEMTQYRTAFLLLHKMRSALYAPERKRLTSKCADLSHTDHWVEVDEIQIGGKQSLEERRDRGSNKSFVAIAVEVHEWKDKKGDRHTKAGRCRLRVIPGATGAVLGQFVDDCIEYGSTLWTDCSAAYGGIGGYQRRTTLSLPANDPLPTIGRVTVNLKRWLAGTHKDAVRPQHLQTYLNEYVYRFNRRDMPWVSFDRILELTMLGRDRPTRIALDKGQWQHRRNPR